MNMFSAMTGARTSLVIDRADAALLAEAYRFSQFSDITTHGNGYRHGVPERVKQALYRVLDACNAAFPDTVPADTDCGEYDHDKGCCGNAQYSPARVS